VLNSQLHGVLRDAHQLCRDEYLDAVRSAWLLDVQRLARRCVDAVHAARHIDPIGNFETGGNGVDHDRVTVNREHRDGRTLRVKCETGAVALQLAEGCATLA
jgi:hypothetical protein